MDARSRPTVTSSSSWSSSVFETANCSSKWLAKTCFVHETSYSVPLSESATRLLEEKRGPTCTNCGSLQSRSASASDFLAASAAPFATSPDAACSALIASAAAFRCCCSCSGATVTAESVNGVSDGGDSRYCRQHCSSASSGTGSGSIIILRPSSPPTPTPPASMPLSIATKKVARSRTSSSLSKRQRWSSTMTLARSPSSWMPNLASADTAEARTVAFSSTTRL
mmetsp:Transcript_21996/g.37607  ORF Transcript_21996/g.37607 Transcript_21996/m.37607 type:complete len:225 (-) Transcript_21996:1538-2212(-)